jgi:hypothetical protein
MPLNNNLRILSCLGITVSIFWLGQYTAAAFRTLFQSLSDRIKVT